jgi:hypothetical protein
LTLGQRLSDQQGISYLAGGGFPRVLARSPM